MVVEASNVRDRRLRRAWKSAGAAVIAVACGAWLAADRLADPAPQSAIQRAIADSLVVFEFTQTDSGTIASSRDQISVIFSNRSAEGRLPPVPFFGEDILQEFSFSAMNLASGKLRFTRRVRDRSFIDARYIRVVNHGSDGWMGNTISLTVDGEAILRAVGMFPRRVRTGQSATGGIEKFNPVEWASRSYWEGELQSYRAASKRQ